MSLATPASQERAFGDIRRLMRRGRRLLLISGILALAFFLSIIAASFMPGSGEGLLVIGDYVVTLGIATPGLTLYILRLYTDRSIRRGNPKIFSNRAKIALVSVNWAILLSVVALLITRIPI